MAHRDDGTWGRALARLISTHPRLVLLAALLLALAAWPGAARLRLDTTLTDLLPRSIPGAAAFARYTEVFAAEQRLVIVAEARDTSALAAFVERYAQRLSRHPAVGGLRLRLGTDAAAFVRDHLLGLLDDAELERLRERSTDVALAAQAKRLRSLLAAPGGSALAPVLTTDPLELLPVLGERLQSGLPVDTRSGYFRSADGQAQLLFVQCRASLFDIEAERRLLADAAQLAREAGGHVGQDIPTEAPAQPTVWFTGAPAYAVEYRDWIHHDLTRSTLISASAVLLLFALFLGALRVLPLVALPLGLGLWLTAAAAGLLLGRVNAVSLAFGTILLAIGIDVPIQLYNRLREELAVSTSPREAVATTIHRLAAPALVATLGPVVVFVACVLSRYRGLAELGLLAALGLMLNLVAMLTVLPALLVVLPARWWLPARRPPTEGSAFAWLGRHAAAHPNAMLAVCAGLALLALPASRKLGYAQHLVSIEPQNMRAVAVARELERRMGQRRTVLIALVEDADPARALERSEPWRRAGETLRRQGLLTGYQALGSLFPSRSEQTRRHQQLAALDPPRLARRLRAALADAGMAADAFAPFLSQLEHGPAPLELDQAPADLRFLIDKHVRDRDGKRLIATLFFVAPAHLAAVSTALRDVARQDPGGTQLTGIPVVEDALRDLLAHDLRRITALAVVAVVLVLVLYYRTPRPILAVLLPLGLAWLLFGAALGLIGIPLTLFNLLTVPLVIGYGIDDHIFLVHRFLETPHRSPAQALGSTGRAIVVTSLSTIAGFAGLWAARFEGLRLLGWSGSLAVALCLLSALAVLPALLARLWPRAAP